MPNIKKKCLAKETSELPKNAGTSRSFVQKCPATSPTWTTRQSNKTAIDSLNKKKKEKINGKA